MNIIWKKTLKSLIIIIILLLLFTFIGNIFYYFDIFSNNTMKYFEMIMSLFSTFIGGFILGLNITSKGYFYGLRLSLILVLIFVIFGIIFNNIHFLNIIYYIIITICTTFATMLGMMKKNI